MKNQDSGKFRLNPKTGKPWFWEKWSEENRRLYLRSRAARAGVDTNALEALIREVMEHITPDIKRMFKTDIPYQVGLAIAELKAQRGRGLFKTAKAGPGCGGAKHYGYDIEGKTRRFCSHE